ncbi:MAG: META domain-containing protein [Bacteroidales bacterium]|nr:META domain-containing protein [Bacteroidales bacterium]
MKHLFNIALIICILATACKSEKNSTKSETAEEQQIPSIEQVYGGWTIVSIENTAINFEASLEITKGEFSAVICNTMAGKISQKERRPDAIRLEIELASKRLCAGEEGDEETHFMNIVPEIRSFAIEGDMLKFLDENEKVLMVCKKN